MAMNNSLAEVHPELVSEWSEKNLPLFPALAVSYYSNKKGLKAELGRMATESGFVRYTFEKVILLKEIFAAKGNALITRAVARDLYDWCNMVSEGLFEEQRDLFRKCFLFYMTISADTLNKSFDTSAIDTLDFNKIRRDLFPVLNKKDNFQLDERKKIAKNYISDLMVLTTKEKEYLDRFEEKKYMPELLFEGAEIVERVKNHPMALWKCKE